MKACQLQVSNSQALNLSSMVNVTKYALKCCTWGAHLKILVDCVLIIKAVPLWASFAPNVSKLKIREMYLMVCTIIPSVQILNMTLNTFTF